MNEGPLRNQVQQQQQSININSSEFYTRATHVSMQQFLEHRRISKETNPKLSKRPCLCFKHKFLIVFLLIMNNTRELFILSGILLPKKNIKGLKGNCLLNYILMNWTLYWNKIIIVVFCFSDNRVWDQYTYYTKLVSLQYRKEASVHRTTLRYCRIKDNKAWKFA